MGKEENVFWRAYAKIRYYWNYSSLMSIKKDIMKKIECERRTQNKVNYLKQFVD